MWALLWVLLKFFFLNGTLSFSKTWVIYGIDNLNQLRETINFKSTDV